MEQVEFIVELVCLYKQHMGQSYNTSLSVITEVHTVNESRYGHECETRLLAQDQPFLLVNFILVNSGNITFLV